MQLLYNASALTAPTFETLQNYADMRFQKLMRYLPRFDGSHRVKIKVRKERHMFVVSVEFNTPEPVYVKARDKDLRKAIDDAYAVSKKTLLRSKGKKQKR